MSEHHNAKTTPLGRQLLVDRVLRNRWSVEETAEVFGISVRSVYKWLARYRAEGGRLRPILVNACRAAPDARPAPLALARPRCD